MIDIEPLLEPIPGENPSGKDLRFSPLFDKIKEARRPEDTAPMGEWAPRDQKSADFRTVVRLADEGLRTQTKDLWLGAWLLDAWTTEHKLEGLAAGLHFLTGLLERFWDTVYPMIDEGDLDLRTAALEWVGSYFNPGKGSSPIYGIRSTALTGRGLDWFAYIDSRNPNAGERKVSLEEFEKDFNTTPKAFYRKLSADGDLAKEALKGLDEVCETRFGKSAPNFGPLRSALEEFENAVQILLHKKLDLDPDPITPGAGLTPTVDVNGLAPLDTALSSSIGGIAPLDLSNLPGGQLTNSGDAALHIVAAANLLRKQSPANPVSYLLIRALRWGELRAMNDLSEATLEAPPAEVRRMIRQYMAQRDWSKVLEMVETAMSSSFGRGWLDLQRYAVLACEGLGYKLAAKAIRAEVKALLADFPQLPTTVLNDDTGAANPETLKWLQQEGLSG
jgi:type VI secretion system protein ImpA